MILLNRPYRDYAAEIEREQRGRRAARFIAWLGFIAGVGILGVAIGCFLGTIDSPWAKLALVAVLLWSFHSVWQLLTRH